MLKRIFCNAFCFLSLSPLLSLPNCKTLQNHNHISQAHQAHRNRPLRLHAPLLEHASQTVAKFSRRSSPPGTLRRDQPGMKT